MSQETLSPTESSAQTTTANKSVKQFKVLLINPPHVYSKSGVGAGIAPPLSIMYLGAVCERQGYNVRCLDTALEAPEQVSELKIDYLYRGMKLEDISKQVDPDTDVVGLTNLFSISFPIVVALANKIKEDHPSVKLVVGGAHPSGVPREALGHPSIEYVILSEGEDTFIALCEAIRLNDYFKFKALDGIAYRENGEIIVKPKLTFNQDLDALPFPARHLVPHDQYSNLREAHGPIQGKYTTMLTSRGCPFKCTFCTPQLWNFRYRVRSAQNVVDEIEYCYKNYGITEFHIEDENLTVNKARLLEICNEIKRRNLKIKWQTPNGIRASVTDWEMLRAMKDSGCYHITVAPESGSERVLKEIVKKTQNLESVTTVVERASKLGINVAAYMMLGLPGEKKEDVELSIKYMMKLAKVGLDEVAFGVFVPLPGSALFTQLQKEGKLPDTWEGYASATDMSKVKSWSEYMPDEEVLKLRNKGYMMFHLTKFIYHPGKVLKSIINIFTGKQSLKTEKEIQAIIKRFTLTRFKWIFKKSPDPLLVHS